MARATSSLPVPVAPSSSTLVEVGAARRASRHTSCMAGLEPTISGNGASRASVRAIASERKGFNSLVFNIGFSAILSRSRLYLQTLAEPTLQGQQAGGRGVIVAEYKQA